MKKLLLWLLIVVPILAAHNLRAQQRTITGRVIGSDGGTIPGVTVLVKGGAQGTATGADGKYSLPVPPTGATLVFSFVGYTSQEIAVGSRNSVDVTLVASAADLDEVVVVGYGTQSRRELTGAVSTITGREIATTPVQSFDQALQGRASGVNITTPNGVLNNPPVIRIRGANSIALSSSPLVVIDGIPTYSGNTSAVGSVPNNPLSNVNPEDIENVEVLKDASATAIYGSRANGGVILITTKKGRKGQSHVSYDTWVGLTTPVRLYNILGAQDYINIKNESVRNLNANRTAIGAAATNVEGFKPSYNADGSLVDTRWYDYIYRTGISNNQNLNFSGGTDKTTYYASVGYTKQKGMLVRNDFRRYSARLNVDQKVFDRLSVGVRVNYSNSFNSAPNSGSVADGAFGTAGLGRLPLVLPPNISPYNADGTYNTNGAGIGAGANINPTTGAALLPGYYNPVVDLDNNYFTSESNQLQGSLYADLEVIKGLHLRTTYGLDNLSFEDKSYYTALAGDGYSTGGSASDYYRTNKRWDWQNTAQYDRAFGEHNLSLLLGNEQQFTQTQRWGATRTNVADPFFTTFQGNYINIASAGQSQGSNYLASFFGRFNYSYAHKYLATLNVRRDGYSAWAQKWGNFYGASLGYIVSEESFWKDANFAQTFDFLKFSGSYGSVGNNQGIFDYASQQLYGSALYGNSGTFYLTQAGNPNLTWETSKKTDASVSFGLFQSRLTGDVTYYRNLIDGLILDVPQAPSRGIPSINGPGTLGNSILANIGSMQNEGVEVNLRYNVLQGKGLTWTVSGNLTTLKNRVLSLLNDEQRIGTATSGLETANYTTVGRSIGSILAVPDMGVDPRNGQRMVLKANGSIVEYNHLGTTGTGSTGWTNVADGSNTTAPTQLTDGVYYGPTLPTWYGGLDNTFRFKNFDLGVFIQYSGGNYIYNGTKSGLHDQRFWNNQTDILDRWTSPTETPNAKYPRVVYGDNVSNGSTIVMSQNVEKGDFARLRNVLLGYTFTSGLLNHVKLSSARVYVQVQNAALLTKYSGIDPEVSSNGANNTAPGVDRNSVGQARSYTAGLNVTF
ncbi:SusC/RagA family TonB-linked outer membrane protein [Hymenobacter sp. HMF4947]|uniref:SusC/RagA family TonB-linked outer membrane protein n=1 Tax=Hymenobacter ginkgonis TaxID=2682976 RepID=A0A7K1TA99_9BACT|nr:TonB-dependent receptor [Hymenobacter ginkgonis]MVN75320.1 SusC/RagA family TonB-linked outer membrane protein [Hymenobacter ginkgonis]